MKSEPDVLIAGAGPTGLTLACGLLANGVAARVVDKAVGPAGTSRALGLQPRGIEVVERLGALNGLPERALQVEQIVVHINGKHAASVRVGQRTALVTRPGLVISQAEVEAALRRRVTELGGEIVWGREVTAAEQDSDGVTVSLADGGRSRAGWLVGCDGAHSRVRELAGVGFPGAPLAERFLLVDAHADLPLSRHSIYAWLAGDSVFGAFPLPGKDVWRLMAPAADADANLVTDEAVLAEVARLLGERTGCDPSLIRDPEWVTSFRVHRRLADTYRNIVARLLRDRLFVPLMNTAAMQRRVWEGLSQLRVTYRSGPLGRRARKWFSGQGPLPGDRVPDIDCVRADDGAHTTLHAELGNKWALVMPGRMVSDECAGVVARRLGDHRMITLIADSTADIMLVRPDAHLGWRGGADLDRWLTAVARLRTGR